MLNGCEADIFNSLNNCGQCGFSCDTLPYVASAECFDYTCDNLTCETGYYDCDGVSTNGCEAHLRVDNDNCGTCGTVCVMPAYCILGNCVWKVWIYFMKIDHKF